MNTLLLVTEISATLALGYVAISFLERWIHRNFMHRDRYLRIFFKPDDQIYKFIYLAHAQAHHRWYYKIFNYEPDEYGRWCNLRLYLWHGAVLSSPLWGGLCFYSPACGITLLLMAFTHTLLWNAIHVEMHVPSDRFWRHWSAFRFLNRYHFMHHRYPGKNFNIVCPLADHLLGSYMKPGESDLQAMQELGLLTVQERARITTVHPGSRTSLVTAESKVSKDT